MAPQLHPLLGFVGQECAHTGADTVKGHESNEGLGASHMERLRELGLFILEEWRGDWRRCYECVLIPDGECKASPDTAADVLAGLISMFWIQILKTDLDF